MNNLVLEKTDKGREEVATRKYQLPSKIRSLLVMIDGNTPMENLLKKAMAIGLDEKSFAELMSGQFVRDITARYDQ